MRNETCKYLSDGVADTILCVYLNILTTCETEKDDTLSRI